MELVKYLIEYCNITYSSLHPEDDMWRRRINNITRTLLRIRDEVIRLPAPGPETAF